MPRRMLVMTLVCLCCAAPVLAAETLSDAVQANRMTVVEVNERARQFRCAGHGWMSAAQAVVIRGKERAVGLGLLKAGDVIKVRTNEGQVERIVVLREASDETTSLEH